MLIEIAAALELILVASAWTKRRRAKRWQMFMGKRDSIRLPIVDDYLRRQTAGASRTEAFAASQLAAVCRKAVQTHAFQSLLLHGIHSARSRNRFTTSNWRITQ
jgi:hypothetical protein